MIVPSIDIMDGKAVQLVGGERLELEAGDPLAVAERFGLVGELAVIDLDAAMGKGDNSAMIEQLVRRYPCRVGGGIRDEQRARRWLDAGARRIILGSAAEPDLLSRLPRQRLIAALDARDGEVVVDGWRQRTGRRVEDRIGELRAHVGGFLITAVEREGALKGVDLERVRALRALCGEARLTFAGGVRTAAEVGDLDALGVDAQVGMALYKKVFDLADAVGACLRSDRPDGLWPTVVCDERGVALGLCYSDLGSLRAALAERAGVYHSRRRGLWRKGASSGAAQELVRIDLDCDRDCLRFTVRQQGAGFCHAGTRTCWGADGGLGRLARRLAEPATRRDAKSYTTRLLQDCELMQSKLMEEAGELVEAASGDEVTHEAADVIYFTLVRMQAAGVDLEAVERELDRRALRLSRRPGDAKPGREASP
ncbi:MAG: phosphoribosyl-ATP diphosphatase [Phycisphaerales bacterium JB039]